MDKLAVILNFLIDIISLGLTYNLRKKRQKQKEKENETQKKDEQQKKQKTVQ